MHDSHPTESDTEIAVITVNYGTAELTIAAVESVLARDHGGRGVEMHVVDNASPGDDAARLAEAHEARGWGDRVRLWLETENHGFGRGNNLVLRELAGRETPPRYVFLLNPDAELVNEAVDRLARALEADPAAAGAGAGITGEDGKPAVACFRFPSLVRELIEKVDFGPLDRLVPRGRRPLPPERPEGEVDWVAGASVLFRLDALRKVGFFDPDYFLYYEEVDLMRRLREAGYRTLYVPQARVTHIAGAATNVASHDTRPKPRPAYLYQSWRMYFQKRHGRGYALATALLSLPAAALGLALARARGRRSALPVGYFRDHWRHAVRPLLTGAAE